jgi:DNA-binding CsgD family transcriptional regulator
MVWANPEDVRLSQFTDELYDAAVDPALWQPIALKLAQLFDSESCMLLMAFNRGGSKFLGVTDNIRGEVWEDYQSYYYAHDQWITGGLSRPGQAVLGHEIAPEAWFRKSEFLNELAVRAGIYSLVGTALPLGGDRSAVVGIHRPKHRAPFDGNDVRRLDSLIPHLKRAMQLSVRLSDAGMDHQAALDGLERSHSATIVVDANGMMLFATCLAEAIVRRGEGLHALGGRLSSPDRMVAARLALLVRAAAGAVAGTPGAARCGGIAIERGEDRLPLTVLVAPFRPKRAGFGAPQPAALVFIRDPETSSLAVEVLRDLFGLTPAQAAVAGRLAEGENLEHIAAKLRITLHTARDHLKVAFAKTGTSRQSQLVALLTRTVAAFGDMEGTADVIDAGRRLA